MVSIVNKYYGELSDYSEEPFEDSKALLSYVLKCDPLLVWRELSDCEKAQMDNLINMRKSGIPIAYITGHQEFMGLDFIVNENTLIPRQDTETIVETLMDMFKGSAPKILDLCCGSGCIGISLAHYLPLATVTLGDISEGALQVAEKNIELNNVKSRVKTTRLDALSGILPEKYNLIVSNPPYIASDIVPTLDVSHHEPLLALDGGNDGLMFYRKIIPTAFEHLLPHGTLALEIGYDQGQSVSKLVNDTFKNAFLKKDYCGNDRMVYAVTQ